MTKEEILAMKPGRELNIAVAKFVMEHDVIVDETFGDMERHVVDNCSVWDSGLETTAFQQRLLYGGQICLH